MRRFEGHTSDINSVAFSSDGRFALTGSHDLTMRWWDVKTGKELHCFEGHSSAVWSVALSPDDRRALSAGTKDKTIRLWDVGTGKALRSFEGDTIRPCCV